MRQRLGTFFIFVGFICLIFFASDIAHDYVIDNFAPFWLGLIALIVGVPLWLSRSGPPEEKPPVHFRFVRSIFGGADKSKKK